MRIVFSNKGSSCIFTDKWIEYGKTQKIYYDTEKHALFDIEKISLDIEKTVVSKTVNKKKLFKTITEQVDEEVTTTSIHIEYYLHTYDKHTTNLEINVLPYEVDNAKKVVEYINGFIEQRNKEKEEKQRIENEKLQNKIKAEEERLANCKYDLVVIDFETTGLKSPLESEKYDEILSVSIIDQDGNELLNSLCKPQRRKTWAKAQEIHGISPAMVKNQPSFEELFPRIKEILYQSKIVLAYNIEFEMVFLWGYDIEFGKHGGSQLIKDVVWGPDPMLMYCAYKGTERWQKLATVAKDFKYDFEAHDSLEDVKATLHCYKKLLEYVKKNPTKDYIIKYGYIYDDGRKGRWLDLNSYEIMNEKEL